VISLTFMIAEYRTRTSAMIKLLQVMYHFANAEGTLNGGSLSCYFGFASDLYHFGHFALKFKTR
jgi:hypothetical protein